MITPFTRHVYLPLLDRVKRAPFGARFAEAERNLALDRPAFEALQRDKLRAMVAYAQRSCPYYARTLSGIAADRLDFESLAELPMIGKPEVHAHHATMRGDAPRGRVFSGTTSGSTGIAMQVWQDSEHQAWVEASVWRGRRWWGVERGDLQLVLWSRPADNTAWTSRVAWMKYRLRNCIQLDTFQDFDEAAARRLGAVLKRRRPRHIYGYGSSIARLAEFLDAMKIRLTGPERPRMVEYTADHLYPREAEVAERVFGVPVTTAYGASEVGGVAQQCRHGRLHLSLDQAVYEIVGSDGRRAAEGEVGEIVLTSLNNFAMPLIRYRIGDLGTWSSERCACGRALPIMTLQVGKAVDLVHTSFRTGVSAHVLDYINLFLMRERVRGIRQFYVEQQALDRFELRVVRDAEFDPRSVEIFVAKMKEYFGEGIEVNTSFVGDIPLEPTGKRRYFKTAFTRAESTA